MPTPSNDVAPFLNDNRDVFGHYTDHPDVFFELVELSPMAMILTNPRLPDNPIVFTNRAFSAMTGYAASEILGRNCRFLQGPDSDPATVARIREGIATRTDVIARILNYRKDGSSFWNAVLISPVYSRLNELVYFSASEIALERWVEIEQPKAPIVHPGLLAWRSEALLKGAKNLVSEVKGYSRSRPGEAGRNPPEIEALASTAASIEIAAERLALLIRQLTLEHELND